MKKRLSVLLVFIALTVIFSGGCGSGETEKKSNVLVISCSGLRPDHLPYNDYGLLETPNIDKLAMEGYIFENVYTPSPVILPSNTSLHTGLYPEKAGILDNMSTLNEDATTLASVYKNSGYRTSAFVSLSPLARQSGLNRGFSTYNDVFVNGIPSPYEPYQQRSPYHTANKFTQWLEKENGPFFSWVHFSDPRRPYSPPRAQKEKFNSPYNAEIAYVDQQIGRIIQTLKKKNIYEKTTIVFTSDSGSDLEQHGKEVTGMYLYNSTLRIPLVIKPRFSDINKSKRYKEGRHRIMDIFPTLLNLSNLDTEVETDGTDLLRKNGSGSESPLFFTSNYPVMTFLWEPSYALLDGKWKLLSKPSVELYNIKSDPHEKKQITDEKVKSRLAGSLKRHTQKLKSRQNIPQSIKKSWKDLGLSTAPLTYPSYSEPDSEIKTEILTETKRIPDIIGNGEIGRAKDLTAKLLKKDPGNPRLLGFMSSIHLKNRNYDRAKETLRKMIENNPVNYVPWANLGNLFYQKENYKEALNCYGAALDLAPGTFGLLYNIGNVHRKMGNNEKTGEFYLRALEINDRNSNLLFNLGRYYEETGQTGKAIQYYRDSMKYWTGKETFYDRVNIRIKRLKQK